MVKRVVISLLITLLLIATKELSAQNIHCGTMIMDSIRRAEHPGILSLSDFEGWLQTRIAAYKMSRSNMKEQVYTIPVIVHVIHNGTIEGVNENISQAQVYSQIDVINEDFRRLNADTTDTPVVFQPVAADIGIEFCPAQIDPNGNVLAEPGIDRVMQVRLPGAALLISIITSSLLPSGTRINTAISGLLISGIAACWDMHNSLKTLTCRECQRDQRRNTDGVVITYDGFGRIGNLTNNYDLGRT